MLRGHRIAIATTLPFVLSSVTLPFVQNSFVYDFVSLHSPFSKASDGTPLTVHDTFREIRALRGPLSGSSDFFVSE